MRRKFNKIISAVLVGAMVFGLAACGNQEVSKNTEPSEESTVTSETTVTTEPEAYTLTYPLDTDYTLTYWGTVPYAFDDLTKPYTAGLIERTGINLDATIVASSDATNQYNLLLTEEKLPDLIVRNLSGSALQQLYEDGAIWDLAPYLEEYAPDYWAYLNAEGNEDLLKLAKDDEGRILAIGSYLEGTFNGTYSGPVIRKDWLEECGLPMPVTLEDWETTLVAFKEKYGATFSFAWSRILMGIASGTGAMGGIKEGNYYVDNGKVQYSSVQPEFKEMLEVLARWNKMGLLDQDSFSQKDKDIRQKVMDGKVGLSFAPLSQMTNWIADAKAEGGSGAEWVGVSYPRTEAGAPTSMIQAASRVSAQKTVVTTSVSEEDLKIVLAWINYGFTEEGFIYQNFGEEGVAHTVDAQGNVTGYTDAVKGSTLCEFIDNYTGTGSSAICGIQASDLVRFKNDPVAVEAVSTWTENTEAIDHLMPSLIITDDSYKDKYNAVYTYVNEQVMKFILGDRDLAEFDTFVKEVNEMGLKDCIELQQKAYDAYLAR